MEERPRLDITLTQTDKLLEILGWLIIGSTWIWLAINYNHLPETIPTHYNTSGQVDGFGSKSTIFILPFISTILFTGMTVLNKYPHIFNYPTKITEENAARQYTNATRMIRFLKLDIVIVFGYSIFQTIQNANGKAEGLGIWFLPITLGLTFIPVIYFIARALKQKS